MPTGAQASLANRHEFPDLFELQAEPLGSLDESEALDVLVAEQPVATRAPGHLWEQTDALVLADRVRRRPDSAGEL
ncbi:MAG: hypothetical protein M3O70_28245 [Actinomycetota bacterium]|nr:hypothetical protein [Actinomycetota bacterium]